MPEETREPVKQDQIGRLSPERPRPEDVEVMLERWREDLKVLDTLTQERDGNQKAFDNALQHLITRTKERDEAQQRATAAEHDAQLYRSRLEEIDSATHPDRRDRLEAEVAELRAELERERGLRTEDEKKVKAFNLLLTAVNPTVRALAGRYLEGVEGMDEFLKFLRSRPDASESGSQDVSYGEAREQNQPGTAMGVAAEERKTE